VSVGDNSEVASRAQLVDTQALELSDAELENVSGGFLDHQAAKCYQRRAEASVEQRRDRVGPSGGPQD